MNYRHTIQDIMQVATQKSGIEGWVAYEWEAVGDDSIVKGCVPNGVYSKGPRKGQPRISVPVEGTTKRIVVSTSEADESAERFIEETGRCYTCKGERRVWDGWSAAEGNSHKDCSDCATVQSTIKDDG